ncbi:MAG: MOP flippase family protein [Saprospiraceae bacterium]|nr:MOP flippase family protein [Saprospiraceae bacterium]
MEFQKEVKSGFKWTSLSMIGGSLLQFLQVVILARLLDPADFGVFALTLVFIRFCQPLVELGFGAAIIQRQELRQIEISTLFWLNFLLGMLFFFLLYAFSPWVADWMEAPILSSLLPVIALGFLIVPLGIQPQAFLQKKFHFKSLTLVGLLSFAVDFLLSIGFALKGYGAWSLVAGYLGRLIINTVGMLWAGYAHMDLRPKFQFNVSESRGLIKFGLFETGSLLSNLAGPGIEKLIIGKLLGTTVLGVYAIIWDLITIPYGKVNPILTKVAFPLMSKFSDSEEELRKWYQLLFKGILLINIPIYAVLITFPTEVLQIGFGEQWVPGAYCLRLMGIYGLFRALMHPGATLLLSLGKTNVSFLWNLIWLAGSLTVLIILLQYFPELNTIGVSYLLSLMLFYWIWIYLLVKHGKINWLFKLNLTGKYLAMTGAFLGFALFLYNKFFLNNYYYLGSVIIIFGVIYALTVFTFERQFLKNIGFGKR